MKLKILYGIETHMIDVTNICLKELCSQNIVFIPSRDPKRSYFFSDPLYGEVKNVYIYDENDKLIQTVNDRFNVYIDCIYNNIYIETLPQNVIDKINYIPSIHERLHKMHRSLSCIYGPLHHEYEEQIMTIMYLTGNEKVLEIGANIGRNSVIIAYILKQCNNNNFVALETHDYIAKQLEHVRDFNNFSFYIENSALSKRKIIQKEWNTIVSDIVLDGWQPVNTITFNDLKKKYNIDFDTLILDCEGAFFQILLDMPEILTNIKLITMENDYDELWKKKCVDHILTMNGFKVVYSKPLSNQLIDEIHHPCKENLYEVWKRDI